MSIQPAHMSKRYFAIARDFWCVEQNKLVDQTRFEGRSIEGWPGFQKDAEDLAPSKVGKDSLQVDVTAVRPHAYELDSRILQLARFRRIQRRSSEHQQIIVRRFHNSGLRR